MLLQKKPVGSHFALHVSQIDTLLEQRRAKDACYASSCCGWQKGTSRNKVVSSSEEIKPIALSIVELQVYVWLKTSVF